MIVKQEGVWVAWNEMLSGVSHHVPTSIVCAIDHHTTPPRLECSCCVNSILEIIGKCFWATNEWPLLSNAMLWLLWIQFKLFAQMTGPIIVSNKKCAGLLKTHWYQNCKNLCGCPSGCVSVEVFINVKTKSPMTKCYPLVRIEPWPLINLWFHVQQSPFGANLTCAT